MDIPDTVKSLPEDLESIALDKFDKLQEKGDLLYIPPRHHVVTHDGFTFDFIISEVLTKKPQLADAAQKPGGPFPNPDPSYIVAPFVGPDHYLTLNKYSVSRPQYILPTLTYSPQASQLTPSDLSAAFAVLLSLKTEHMVIYNCGPAAGASQGHKHLQILPVQRAAGFRFFTDDISIPTERPVVVEGVPHRCFVVAVPDEAKVEDLVARHEQLLALTYAALDRVSAARNYNIIIAKSWMMAIPRAHRDRDGIATNAMGMVGVCWVKHEEEMRGWERLGWGEHLKWLGMSA
ncbi:uncharacterized protein LTR77_005083 [Saxophila tyrrhenica]|uniref:Ap4A phosphorylase II n=1 Tax=Saxophila tyrrhenica TaxID=1690608 RepID=A0AAV9PE87_9PEZI|nr:hypothetical protein LTR77_005083 [Saxophila tyrrhenica]